VKVIVEPSSYANIFKENPEILLLKIWW